VAFCSGFVAQELLKPGSKPTCSSGMISANSTLQGVGEEPRFRQSDAKVWRSISQESIIGSRKR
jgi:hypothetical protein